MRLAFFSILALLAAGFVLALLIGVAVRIAVFVGLVALILLAASYVIRKIGLGRRRALSRDRMKGPLVQDAIVVDGRERLPR